MVQLHSCVQMSKAVTHGDQCKNRGRSALWLTPWKSLYLNQQAVNSRRSKRLQAIASGETLAHHRRNTLNHALNPQQTVDESSIDRSRPSHPSQIFTIKTQITIKSSRIRPWQQRSFFYAPCAEAVCDPVGRWMALSWMRILWMT